MSRTEWPVWANGRCSLVSLDVRADATREQLNDAAVAKAVAMGHTDAEPFLTLEDGDDLGWEYDPSVKDARNV